MKRQKRAARPTKKRKAQPVPPADAPGAAPDKSLSRRAFVSRSSKAALIVAATGGTGWYFVDEVCATTREIDLTRIGNGIPAVVQIHDPECPRCRALQREVRKAMSKFNADELQYLVANIRSADGRRLANQHRVSHITLLLFDGKGNRRRVLVGQNTSDILEDVFRSHLARDSRE